MTETASAPSPASRHYTIEQTGKRYLMAAGFPPRDDFAAALADAGVTVLCLFPHTYRSEQTQVQLRDSVRAELARQGAAHDRCMTLVINDASLGESLEDFDFEGACQQALERVTPKQPRIAAAPIPSFG